MPGAWLLSSGDRLAKPGGLLGQRVRKLRALGLGAGYPHPELRCFVPASSASTLPKVIDVDEAANGKQHESVGQATETGYQSVQTKWPQNHVVDRGR